jgi:periplasmic protein TonB
VSAELSLPQRSRAQRALAAIDARWPSLRRKAGGLLLALALEAALFLLLLTLGQNTAGVHEVAESLTTIDFTPEPPPADAPEPEQAEQPTALPRAAPAPRPEVPQPPQPMPPPAAVIPVSPPTQAPEPAAPATPRIKAVVRSQVSGPTGPPNRPTTGDSERIGTAGNGEPLYRARWYREPTDQELRGYLSTASGPGYALINCRTVPDFRVEDCELVDEYPNGAQLGRAVLAAAWQFKVRPPQLGGRSLVGAWVRIRITYDYVRPGQPG